MTTRKTNETYPWAERVGGGYPSFEELLLAAEYLSFPVKVGTPHPEHGYFMVRDREPVTARE